MDSSFLSLPVELRLCVLRYLLVSPDVIMYWDCKDCVGGLHPGILRANKQMYAEGLHVLYSENTFLTWLLCYRLPGWISTGLFDHYGCRNGCRVPDHYGCRNDCRVPNIHMIQNHKIRVHLEAWQREGGEEEKEGENTRRMKNAIRQVVTQLSGAPLIRNLRISISLFDMEGRENCHFPVTEDCEDSDSEPTLNPFTEDCEDLDSEDDEWLDYMAEWAFDKAYVLQPFALLRNVRRAEVRGRVRPRYRQYLKTVMEGKALVDDLHKKYDALVRFTHARMSCEGELQDACYAMQHGDAKKLELVKADVTQKAMRSSRTTLEKAVRRYDADLNDLDILNRVYD